jgi:hypothetical protein
MKVSPKRADMMQLRVLKRMIQNDTLPKDRTARARYVLALARIIANKYPARLNSRPRKDERNAWLAVDYLIRCARPKATKMAESKDLAGECARYRIKITDAAIRKLPKKHPRAKHIAAEMIERAQIFRDPIAAATREAGGHWQRAQAQAV